MPLLPKNSKDVAGIRNVFTALRTQMCSASSAFSDPLKAIFKEITDKFDAVLASLPKDEAVQDWSLECQLENLFSLLANASAVASMAGLELSQIKAELGKNMASAVQTEIERKLTAGELVMKASLDTKVLEAINAKTTAGELIPAATHTQLCSAAKTAGIAEGAAAEKAKVTEAEQRNALVASRTTALTTASVPLPPAELAKILGEPEEAFAAAKTTFEARKAALEKDGFQLNSELLANCWLPEADFGRFQKILAATPSLKIKPEPVTAGNQGGGKAAGFIV